MLPYLKTVIYANGTPFLILFIFLWLVFYNPIFNKRQEKLFLLAGLTDIIMLIVISIDFLTIVAPAEQRFWMIRTFTTFLNFAISPLTPLFLYQIQLKKKSSYYIYIPFLLNFVLCVISLFNGMVFEVTSLNTYGRGSLFLVPFITVLIYVVLLIIQTRKNTLRGKRYERTFLLLVILLLGLAMVLEITFRFKFLSWVCASLSLPLYYLLLNINHAILDPLTGAYNRSMYTKELSHIEHNKECVLAFIDINDFKIVNDTFGHEVGDQQLITLTNTVSHIFVHKATLYRFGGDEFVIVSTKENEKGMTALLEEARRSLRRDNIYFSYGIGTYQPSMVMASFLQGVDQKMYENKKIDKERNHATI